MPSMLTDADLRRYLADRGAFRREQVFLPSGRRLGEVEEPWQREHVFGPLDARDDEGGWRYRVLYFELHRGAAKTFMLAVEALTVAVLEEDWRIYVVAGDAEQASIAKQMLVQLIQRNPALESSFRIYRDEIVVPATGTVIKVMSSDSPTAYGLGALGRGYLVLADELWCWRGRDLWDAFYTAAPKAADWRIIVGSNAGHDQESIAWGVREMCRARVEPRYYFYGPEGVVAGWIAPEDIEMQRRSLPDPVFARLFENRWVSAEGSFIDAEIWDHCADPKLPRLKADDKDTVLVLAVDAAVKHDSFSVLAISRHPDPARHDTHVAVRWGACWTPERGRPVSFYGPGGPDETIREFCRHHHVYTIVADPYQMQSLMQEWRRDGVANVEEFPQGPQRLVADSMLLSLIYEGRVAYGADAPDELRSHMLGAAFKLDTEHETKLRIIKIHPRRRIDLAVCLSMGAFESLRLYL